MAQMVKRLSTMWETQVQSLGWEDPLEKEMAIHSSTIALKIPWTEEPGVHVVTKSWSQLSDFTFFLSFEINLFLKFNVNKHYLECVLCFP